MKKLLIVLAILSFVLTGCSDDDENQVRSFDGVKISYDVQGKGEPVLVFVNVSLASSRDKNFTSDGITKLIKKVNKFTQENPYKQTDRDWIRATYYTGVLGAYEATKDPAYLEQTIAWAEKHKWHVGNEVSGSNKLFCAMSWVELYLLEPDKKKIEPTLKWLATDSLYSPGGAKVWYGHAPAPHDSPLYSDSLYGAPVFAMLYKATGDQKYLDILNDFFWNVTNTILDEEESLYYRDPAYIGLKSPNGKKILWSRGNGWVFAALPQILKYIPKDDPYYERYVDLYNRMAKTLAARQHEDGLWRSNLGDPEHYLMPESSGTSFFTYGFAWGINQGLLDRKVYLPVVVKAWNGLARSVHPNGKLGWVQPVDAQPRPSLPVTTHEYAAGLFMLAGSEVLKLSQSNIISPVIAKQFLVDETSILPTSALKIESLKTTDHPLASEINIFLKRQRKSKKIVSTGFDRKDYLDVIAAQVKAMRQYQDSAGRIIDPITKQEMYFTTPCYAHSVAVLAKANYPVSKVMIESGMRALDVSLKDLAGAKAAGGHGDFYTWPALFAYELFAPSASTERKEKWSSLIAGIDPERSYRAFRKPYKAYEHGILYKSFGKSWANNWNLVNTAGEYLRSKNGFTGLEYVDFCLTMQLPHFNSYGMYNEGGNPFPYDLFSRHYVTGMLHRGYRSFVYSTYRDLLWKGAWTSLFIQSPTGQLPTGYRSSHHIWNEAEQAVVFEIYATQYARAGMMDEAGAFKRAARLALSSVKKWIRPDGTGYIVKNKYPIEDRHGYEGYSQHTCYNMLACSMLAQAWQFADESVKEKPCPADLGGFAVTIPGFHKVFANAGGTYVEYDTSGDQKYNPTGLLRIHLKDGHPQLGPSDGCAAIYSGKDNLFAVGPSWKDADGNWVKLAELTGRKPTVEILESTTEQVRFKVTYRLVNNRTDTHVGLTPDNTVAADGKALWYSTESATAGKWLQRTLNNTKIYEVMNREGANSGCKLKTTLSGLKPGQNYAISAVNGLRDSESWQVLCGLTPNRADAVLSRGMADLSAKITQRGFYHTLIHEGQKMLGTAPASTDGTIDIYTFIPEDVTGAKRCWLAGFTYEPVHSGVDAGSSVDKTVQISEIFTIKPNEVLVENTVAGNGVSQLRVYYPMLVFDGANETDIKMDRKSVRMQLEQKNVCFEILNSMGSTLTRTGQILKHRNGLVEPVYFDATGLSAKYRIYTEQ